MTKERQRPDSVLWKRADVLGVSSALLVAAFQAFALIGRFGRGFPGYDVFAYTLPNAIYARDAVARGTGLLWNDLQNCGQPFFGIISTGVLDPSSVFFYFVAPDTALALQLVFH
jgi:hypothetical protein